MTDIIHHEESDFFDTSKDSRQERKRAKKRDRSQYKKTDQDKLKLHQEAVDITNLRKGIVTSVRPELFIVDSEGIIFYLFSQRITKKR